MSVNEFQINMTFDKIPYLESFCFVKTVFLTVVSSSNYKPTAWNGRMISKERIRKGCGLMPDTVPKFPALTEEKHYKR